MGNIEMKSVSRVTAFAFSPVNANHIILGLAPGHRAGPSPTTNVQLWNLQTRSVVKSFVLRRGDRIIKNIKQIRFCPTDPEYVVVAESGIISIHKIWL